MPNHNLLRRSKIVLGLWPLSGDFGPVKLSDYEQVIIKETHTHTGDTESLNRCG